MKIKVKAVKNFGLLKFYPMCQKSTLLTNLLRQISFSKVQVDMLKEIGFEFEDVTPKIEI
jgi:hypothetical protein